MSNEIVRQIDSPEWESKMDLITRTVAAGANPDELQLFFHQARRTGLDPLARQIYFVKRQGKGTIQVGIDGYRLIAHRSGECGGIDDSELGPPTEQGYPSSARVTVWRIVQGQRCPFTATARWIEYYPGDAQGFQWKKMPAVMLSKCAEAQALRKAFPAELSGVYVDAEMDQAPAPDTSSRDSDIVAAKDYLASIGFIRSTVDVYIELCTIKKVDPWDAALDAKKANCKTPEEVRDLVEHGIMPQAETEAETP